MNQLLSLAMRFRTRFLNPFLKGKIGLNPRSRHRQVKVALTMILIEKLGARRARIANPVKARAALMTRKAMTNSLSFVKKLKRMKCA
jgi:hypothetical protein